MSSQTPPPQSTATQDQDEQHDEPVNTRQESEKGTDSEAVAPPPPAAGVHQKGDWTAVWDPASNAYYFYNTATQATTWTNPLETPTASTSTAGPDSATPSADGPPAPEGDGIDYGGIDPDLAYLDPTLARARTAGGATPAFQARFNSRTGRFQGDPAMNPDRISEYSRGTRQQEAFYNTEAWADSLQGKGLKRSGEAEGLESRKKKVTASDVAKFKAAKEDKKRKKLMDFLK